MKVSVVIPTHNRRQLTKNCLESICVADSEGDFEIVIVDDGSTDGTAAFISRKFPSVTVLQGDGSLYWGGSVHHGTKYANEVLEADVIIWLNPDVRTNYDSIHRIAKTALERNAIVASHDTPKYTNVDYSLCYSYDENMGVIEKPYESTNKFQECDIVAGKFTAIPSDIVDDIGYPNHEVFPHGKCDWDYSLRATESGYTVGIDHNVKSVDVDVKPQKDELHENHTFVNMVEILFTDPSSFWYKEQIRQKVRFGNQNPINATTLIGIHIILLMVKKAILCTFYENHHFGFIDLIKSKPKASDLDITVIGPKN